MFLRNVHWESKTRTRWVGHELLAGATEGNGVRTLNASCDALSPATFCLPSVNSSSPVGENFHTV
jgi:hypothetical protein